MSETISGLLGFGLIVGLFVAYALERRARKRRQNPLPPIASEPVPPTTETSSAGRSSSPNWAMPIVYCLLLAGADTHRGNFWGYLWQALYLALLLLAVYSTFSPKELSAEQARRPGTTRTSHYLTLGVPYVLFPALGWILVELVGWRPGVFVPLLPWLGLAAIAGLYGAVNALRR